METKKDVTKFLSNNTKNSIIKIFFVFEKSTEIACFQPCQVTTVEIKG